MNDRNTIFFQEFEELKDKYQEEQNTNVKLVGQNNTNQRIKIFAKLKEDLTISNDVCIQYEQNNNKYSIVGPYWMLQNYKKYIFYVHFIYINFLCCHILLKFSPKNNDCFHFIDE